MKTVIRIILITACVGGLLFLLMWLDHNYPLATHVIRNVQNVAIDRHADLPR